MRRIYTTLAAMLLAMSMLAAPAMAAHNDNHNPGPPEGLHCDDHSAIEAAGDKVNANETKIITVKDQDGVDHQLEVKNDGNTVTFKLLTEGYTLDKVVFCVKGGTADAHHGSTTTGSYTHGQDISYTVVYAIKTTKKVVEEPKGEWCSPGFWRNSPIQAAAIAGAADLSFLPEGVSYTDVLNSPQTYGGTLFNQVGDALSAAHPDVDFQGERVEDSCPLSADASKKAPKKGSK